MKKLSVALGIAGGLCTLNGISKDDMYTAMGQYYPAGALMAWLAGGMLCIGLAWVICALSERRQ